MRGYAELEIFTKEEQDLLCRAMNLLHYVPTEYEGEYIRCHELARAIGSILGLEVQDGHVGSVEHSWLLLPTGPDGRDKLLDVYTPGRLPQAQLVHLHYGVNREYRLKDPGIEVRENVVQYLIELMKGPAPWHKNHSPHSTTNDSSSSQQSSR